MSVVSENCGAENPARLECYECRQPLAGRPFRFVPRRGAACAPCHRAVAVLAADAESARLPVRYLSSKIAPAVGWNIRPAPHGETR